VENALEFFKVAPQWATLLILGALLIKKLPDKLVGGGALLKPEDFVTHDKFCGIESAINSFRDDVKELRAIMIKHIEGTK
jgi:hypothetical protein